MSHGRIILADTGTRTPSPRRLLEYDVLSTCDVLKRCAKYLFVGHPLSCSLFLLLRSILLFKCINCSLALIFFFSFSLLFSYVICNLFVVVVVVVVVFCWCLSLEQWQKQKFPFRIPNQLSISRKGPLMFIHLQLLGIISFYVFTTFGTIYVYMQCIFGCAYFRLMAPNMERKETTERKRNTETTEEMCDIPILGKKCDSCEENRYETLAQWKKKWSSHDVECIRISRVIRVALHQPWVLQFLIEVLYRTILCNLHIFRSLDIEHVYPSSLRTLIHFVSRDNWAVRVLRMQRKSHTCLRHSMNCSSTNSSRNDKKS